MPKGVANVRPKTVDDLTPQELRVFNKLDEEGQAIYLSTLPPVKTGRVGGTGSKTNKAEFVTTRIAGVNALLDGYEKYLKDLEQAQADLADSKDIDARELRKLPKVDGWAVNCQIGSKPRGPRKAKVTSEPVSGNGSSGDEDGSVIGGKGKNKKTLAPAGA